MGRRRSVTARRTSAVPPGAVTERRTRATSPRTSYQRIYELVRRIPRGRVATYGGVSAAAGLPRAPRVAGYALHALPEGSPIPWHRVVGAGGRLSLARLSPDGATTQRLRLEREGVRFDGRGRVDLDRHEWRGAAARTPRSRAVGVRDALRSRRAAAQNSPRSRRAATRD
jgi:methylated-DNA-protein-cysteine methyltransferase-like protein